jgi:hypothetical protein
MYMLRIVLLMQYWKRATERKEGIRESVSVWAQRFQRGRRPTAVYSELSLKGPPSEPTVDETAKICFACPLRRSGRHAETTFITP